ncbi:hypothetical protein PR202_ga20263 [Eleusine coracana subsp. coracana]|uniref:Uncharacterized protein n=1 Tax=Eleusine coracana subsp. coracana TaxID=191504 RepID=A0AAV5CWX4_ELECO|nr:hypothetical protein PR202_ga20263 [Eleusine coracana subsp. coracana]
MESLVLASSCSAFPRLPLLSAASRGPRLPAAPPLGAGRRGEHGGSGSSSPRPLAGSRGSRNVFEQLNSKGFASVSSSTSNENMSTGTGSLPPVPPSSSYFGSPVFWIGVGVALSVAFSAVSSMLKKYAMQQAFKSMMNQAPPNSFGSNSPFPFAMPQQAAPTAPSSYPYSYSEPKKDIYKQAATVDVSATEVEVAGIFRSGRCG